MCMYKSIILIVFILSITAAIITVPLLIWNVIEWYNVGIKLYITYGFFFVVSLILILSTGVDSYEEY